MTITICAMDELPAELLSRDPHQKFTQPGESIGSFPNGASAISAAQMAKLSHRAIFLGCVGNDNSARLIIERSRHEGIITDGIHVTNNAITGTAFVSYQNSQQRDFVSNIPNNAYGLSTAEHIDEDLLKQCNHLYIVGPSLFSFRMIDVMCRTTTAIKSVGGAVSFNPNVRKEMLSIPEMVQTLDYLIGYTGISIPSKGELLLLMRHKNLSEEQVVSDLPHGGVKHVAIKHVQRGASYCKFKSGILYAQRVAGHGIEIIDPTGVGDCFGTTFVILFLSGFPAYKALQCANTSGAFAVIWQGLMKGISSLADIENFLQQH